MLLVISIVVELVLLGGVAFYFTQKLSAQSKVNNAEAERVLREAQLKASNLVREAELKSQEELFKTRQRMDQEIKERKQEVSQAENRISQKEQNIANKEQMLSQQEMTLREKHENNERQKEKLDALYKEQSLALERVAGLNKEEAKKMFLGRVEQDAKNEAAAILRSIEDQANKTAKQKAKNIVALAIHRTAVDHTLETTTSVVVLPSEDFKGKIIGKEGRNIRAIEHMTGMDIIVDDTPETVIISGFDPIRREIAKRAIQALLVDGRIHPARIEEAVNRARRDVKQFIKEKGEEICNQMEVHNVHPKIQELLGRLYFRTSYGQNNWYHAIEVARLASQMAQELGVNVALAKRAALMHDIGKSLDFEQEGTHPQLGAEFARKHGESPEVVHAILAHHEDVQPATVEAILVLVADAISAARPGARSESKENYIKRLTKLEEIANSFEGVEKTFAIQAGREVRIMVRPDEVDDMAAVKIAHDVAKRIENEMEYPGQVKVQVIRETRAVDVAK
jgi:ribonuclease Y